MIAFGITTFPEKFYNLTEERNILHEVNLSDNAKKINYR